MTRTHYARPADGYRGRVLTAKPAVLAEQELTPIQAHELRVGDVIVRDGFIAMAVTEPVRTACGITHFTYESLPGPGFQAFVFDTPLEVRRPLSERSH